MKNISKIIRRANQIGIWQYHCELASRLLQEGKITKKQYEIGLEESKKNIFKHSKKK